jgi:gliding motility-associated-like protein
MKNTLLTILTFVFFQITGRTQNACIDSSSRFLLKTADNSQIFIRETVTLKDNSIVVAGKLSNSATTNSSTFLARFDANNNSIFSKSLNNSGELLIQKIIECRNGDILVLLINPENNSDKGRITLIRLTSNGSIIWQKSVSSFSAQFDETFIFNSKALNENDTGDIYIGATVEGETNPEFGIFSGYYFIYKLTADGNVIWKATLVRKEVLGTQISGINEKGGTLSVVTSQYLNDGRECITTNSKSIGLIKLDAANGAYLSSKAICLSYSGTGCIASFNYNPPEVEFLSTGKIIVAGNINLCSGSGRYYPAYLLQTDNDFNIIYNNEVDYSTPYGISAGATISVNKLGETFLFTRGFYDNTLYYSIFNSAGSPTKQRKVSLPNNSSFNYGNIRTAFRTKDNYWIVNNISKDNENLNQIMEVKGDNSQTLDCTGEDTLFAKAKPHLSFPIGFRIDTFRTESINTVNTNSTIADILFERIELCSSISICDSLKIKGNQSFCLSEPNQTFTFYKNKECFKKPIWKIDTSAVSQIIQMNDSTITIRFKKSWTGYLYAKTENCAILSDSILISVYDNPLSTNLGKDTTFCSPIMLDAGSNFKSYKWHDNSTSRFYSVTGPGIYYVSVMDYCGNSYSDSIQLVPPKTTFSIGKDTCLTSFPFQLTVEEGYKNYLWQNRNNAASFEVSTSGLYFITAVNHCNDNFTDSINIYQSAKAFKLGNDTVLCPDKTLTLNGPDGYSNYIWQNGSHAKKIEAPLPGLYSLSVTDFCGFTKADTITLVDPGYSFNLLKDTAICNFETLELTVSPGAASYYWQPSYNISSISSNKVSVNPQMNTQYIIRAELFDGCFAFDSINVIIKNCPESIHVPSAFTPNNDGVNDFFKPLTKGLLTDYKFTIYNRWGEKIFETTRHNEGWSGKFKNSLQPSGNYTWILKYKKVSDIYIQTKKGNFILIR